MKYSIFYVNDYLTKFCIQIDISNFDTYLVIFGKWNRYISVLLYLFPSMYF